MKDIYIAELFAGFSGLIVIIGLFYARGKL